MRVHGWHSDSDGGRRSWLNVYRSDGVESSGRMVFGGSFERYRGKSARHTGIGISPSSDVGGVKVFLGLHRVWCGWIGVGSEALFWPALRKSERLQRWSDRCLINVRVHGGAIWWDVCVDQMGSTRGIPRWRHGNLNVVDLVLGKVDSQREWVIEPTPTILPLPEGTYLVALGIERWTWKRPRGRRKTGYSFDLDKVISEPGYIPAPGNSESDFFDGPDGTFSMHGGLTGTPTVQNAIGEIVAHVLTERARRGAPVDYAERIR